MINSVDGMGLPCSQIILRIITKTLSYQRGDIIEVRSDTPDIETGLKEWCGRTRREVASVRHEGNITIIQIKL